MIRPNDTTNQPVDAHGCACSHTAEFSAMFLTLNTAEGRTHAGCWRLTRSSLMAKIREISVAAPHLSGL